MKMMPKIKFRISFWKMTFNPTTSLKDLLERILFFLAH